MALLTDFANSQNADFQVKVRMALISTALAVQAESAGTANHAARSSLAIQILNDPLGYATRMAPAFTVDGGTDLNTTDANLESRASAIFNAYCVQG